MVNCRLGWRYFVTFTVLEVPSTLEYLILSSMYPVKRRALFSCFGNLHPQCPSECDIFFSSCKFIRAKPQWQQKQSILNSIKNPLLVINLMMHFPVFSTWVMFWPTLSAAMTGSSCFNQRLARMISIAAPIVTASFCMYQSSLHLNQTWVTAKSINRFKVLLNNLGCPQPLRVFHSIASCTGTLVYRLLIALI